MAQTAAQRQAHYRARRNDGDGERGINTWVTSATDYALDRLARHHGITRRTIGFAVRFTRFRVERDGAGAIAANTLQEPIIIVQGNTEITGNHRPDFFFREEVGEKRM